MSKQTMTPERVGKEYNAGISFNSGIDLYDCVETNENFFIGKQWEGVQSNGLPTPVFNFLKRVVLFSVANISTDNLKLWARAMSSSGERNTQTLELVADILNDQFASIFEHNSIGGRIREYTRNAAVDGDGCMYTYWDDTAETGQASKGAIRTEVLMNTQVLFGNPNNRDVQSQPYIILERRMLLSEARKRAKRYGKDPDEIQPDNKDCGNNYMDSMSGSGNKATVLYTWLALTVVPSSTMLSSMRLLGPMTHPAPMTVLPRRMVPARITAPGAIWTSASSCIP